MNEREWGSYRAALAACAVVAATALAWASGAQAATGYFPNGWGAINKAMAGAGIAMDGQAPLAAANNPASILTVADAEFQFNLLLLYANPEFEISDPAPPGGAFPELKAGSYKGDPEVPLNTFLVPQGGMNWRVGERGAFAIVVYGNGGLNTTYDNFDNADFCPPTSEQEGIFCGGGAGIDLVQIFISPTFAMQVTPRLRLGVSPILAIQGVEVRGLSFFAQLGLSSEPDSFTDNGHDYELGHGFKFGAQFQLFDTLSLGAVVQTEVDVGSFEKYEGLLPDGGQLDIPGYISLGLAWRLAPRWVLAFDAQKIYYSDVAAQGNEPDTPRQFGAKDGPGFGWEDTSALKLGVQWDAPGDWVWRAGYAHVLDEPVDDDQLFINIFAQSIMRDQVAFGATWEYSTETTLDFSFLWGIENSISGPNPRFPAQEIEVSLSDYELDLSWRHRF